jgi:hypothetical protein
LASTPVQQTRRSSVLTNTEVKNSDEYPASSRYRSTRYFQRDIPEVGTFVEPETWSPPNIKPSSSDLFTKVQSGEEGRLDLVAARVYKMQQLWWVIAFINDIIDPFEEVTVGKILRYPPFDVVSSKVLS